MNAKRYQVLLVEDHPPDVELLREAVQAPDAPHVLVDLALAPRLSVALERLGAKRFDAVLLDLGLPDSQGLDTFLELHECYPAVPVVVLSDSDDDVLATRAVQQGAQDYLVKGRGDGATWRRALHHAIERSRAERRLRESEAIYRSLVHTMPDGVALADLDGTILQANRRLAAQCGYERGAALVGSTLAELIAAPDRERAFTNLLLTIESGHLRGVEYAMERHDGSRFDGEWSIATVRDRDGAPEALVCVVRDITEGKRMRAQLAQSDRLASIGMLAAGVAHEINNPLAYTLYNLETAVQDVPAFTTALQRCRRLVAERLGPEAAEQLLGDAWREPDDESLQDLTERLGDAHSGAKRVSEIVGDLKVFSRVDEERIAPTDVLQVLRSAINLATSELKRRAHLVEDLQPVPTIMSNGGRLSQVFVNLLVNAAQACGDGDLRRNEVRVRTRAEPGTVLVQIEDTGSGIPADQLERIFEPFVTTKAVGVGSGLGLAICKSLIDALGGSIEASSREGQGACFSVRLPAPASPQSR